MIHRHQQDVKPLVSLWNKSNISRFCEIGLPPVYGRHYQLDKYAETSQVTFCVHLHGSSLKSYGLHWKSGFILTYLRSNGHFRFSHLISLPEVKKQYLTQQSRVNLKSAPRISHSFEIDLMISEIMQKCLWDNLSASDHQRYFFKAN